MYKERHRHRRSFRLFKISTRPWRSSKFTNLHDPVYYVLHTTIYNNNNIYISVVAVVKVAFSKKKKSWTTFFFSYLLSRNDNKKSDIIIIASVEEKHRCRSPVAFGTQEERSGGFHHITRHILFGWFFAYIYIYFYVGYKSILQNYCIRNPFNKLDIFMYLSHFSFFVALHLILKSYFLNLLF